MNPELAAIRDKWAEKTQAKYAGFEALQAAKLAEKQGRHDEARKHRAVHAAKGFAQGEEGQHAADQLAMCDAYVAAHPAEFTKLTSMTLEECVQALGVFRANGPAFEDDMLRVEVWLRHHFEPQNIGGEVQARIRIAGLGG